MLEDFKTNCNTAVNINWFIVSDFSSLQMEIGQIII